MPAAGGPAPLRIGVLASQGGFAAHVDVLRGLGAEAFEVRSARDLADLDGLVIPGGESTTIARAIERDGLEPAIRAHVERAPLLGTCAGMIVCDASHLGLIDATARRNAFGRQLQSFEAELDFTGVGDERVRAVFIRAPWIERSGPAVEILAEWDGHPVAIREGNVLATSFHPELTDDSRVHALLMAMATSARARVAEGTEEAR